MENITIHSDFIKLDQLLKWIGIASDGSEARIMIADGYVYVDGELEMRRGRKIYPDMMVKVTDGENEAHFIIKKEQ